MSKHNVSTKDGAMSAQGDKSRRAALRALAGANALAIPKPAEPEPKRV
jgi:hypothetical protein